MVVRRWRWARSYRGCESKIVVARACLALSSDSLTIADTMHSSFVVPLRNFVFYILLYMVTTIVNDTIACT
jgi:hypothetical protein